MTGWAGWIGEKPEAAPRVPMPVTAQLLSGSRGEEHPDVLGQSLARAAADDAREARQARERAFDPDEYASGLVARGYRPGALSQLSQQLADVTAELQSEQEKIKRGARRAERVSQDVAAGRISGFEASARMDGDFGDAHRAEQLQRRADRLQARIEDASAAVAPQYREPDMFEEAGRTAHEAFVEATRARMDAAQARRPFRAPRPFGSVSRGAGDPVSAEHTGPDCEICAAARQLDAARSGADAAAPGAGMSDAELAGMAYR